MPKNQVQFQKSLSLPQFQAKYSSEQQCRQALFKIKFPDGFCCPRCNYRDFYRVKHRQGMICARCRKHVSLRANTLMQHSKLPFTTWFAAIYLITQNKKSVSSLYLTRYLGVSYQTAWLLHQKIIEAMRQQEQTNLLQGIIHVDDGYLGGRKSGVRGRGASGKLPFITALSFKNNKPHQLKLSLVPCFSIEAIRSWSKRSIRGGSMVFSDALPGFVGLAHKNIAHKAINITDKPEEKDSLFRSINTIMGNLKRYLLGIHHAVRRVSCARYLDAFAWRFNHRYDLKAAFSAGLGAIMNGAPSTRKKLQVNHCR